jgi:hypothetical protein
MSNSVSVFLGISQFVSIISETVSVFGRKPMKINVLSGECKPVGYTALMSNRPIFIDALFSQ